METKLQWKLHGRRWVLSNGLHSGRHVGLEQSESRSGVGSTEVCRYRSLGVCPISSRYQEIPRIQLNNSQEIPTRITQLQCHSMSQHVTACHSMSQHTSMGQELLPSVWTLWSILDRWAWTSMSCTACQYHGGFGQNMWWWELDLKSYLSFLSGCQLTIETAWNCEFFFHRGVC